MNPYTPLKSFCLKRQWAANVFIALGILQFHLTIWLAIEHQQTILNWLFPNILVHGLVFSLVCAVNVTLMAAFLWLGFRDCARQSDEWAHTYRGRGTGSAIFPNAWNWVTHIGGKRRG